MAQYGTIDVWRLKNIVSFGEYASKKLKNGYHVRDFVPKFKLHACDFRLSSRAIENPSGIDQQDTKVIAVRHKPNRDYSSYIAKYKGELYQVDLINPDESKLRGFDLISLKEIDKNG